MFPRPIAYLLLTLVSAFLSAPAIAQIPDVQAGNRSTHTVIETPAVSAETLDDIAQLFHHRGSSAVADYLQLQMGDPNLREAWKKFADANGSPLKVLDVNIHPNEAKAIEFMNMRFERMGLPNLQLHGIPGDPNNTSDPTSIHNETIGPWKWFRLLGGPGVAAAAFLIGNPLRAGVSARDYVYVVIPAATVGALVIALEVTFAVPELNNRIWKRLWKLGGPVTRSFVNIGFIFTTNLALFGSRRLGEKLVTRLSSRPLQPLNLGLVVLDAAISAVTFHIALGRYHTALAEEEEHGSIDGNTRYALETVSSVIVNGARVAHAMIGPNARGLSYATQAAFFAMKGLPQLTKTYVADNWSDRRMARELHPENLRPETWGEWFVRGLETTRLYNLPKLQRSN